MKSNMAVDDFVAMKSTLCNQVLILTERGDPVCTSLHYVDTNDPVITTFASGGIVCFYIL